MEPKSPFPDAGTNKPDFYSGVMYCDIEELMKISNDLYVFIFAVVAPVVHSMYL